MPVIELSTKLHGSSVHLLGYFLHQGQMDEFRTWVANQQSARRDRNIRLVARLQELGFDITLEEAEARGRGMTGRPHFAAIMVEKGYGQERQREEDEIDRNPGHGHCARLCGVALRQLGRRSALTPA